MLNGYVVKKIGGDNFKQCKCHIYISINKFSKKVPDVATCTK
jgi:hypothetical protein